MNLRPLLSARLPVLRKTHEDEIKRLEKERLRFVRNYSLKKLPHLALENYAIGRGKGTFCYRIEQELDDLGRILGSPARKFGVYFSRDENRYRFTSIWGTSTDSAYTCLRTAIIKLLQAAAAGDIEALNANRISPMFKGKLLHLYFPGEFAPIFSPEHLRHFVSCLNLSGEWSSSVERQQALMEFTAYS